MSLTPSSNRPSLIRCVRSLALLACAVALPVWLGACGGSSNDAPEDLAGSQVQTATAAAELIYQHMASGDFTAAARMLSDESIAELGGVEAAAERLKSTNPAMIHHGGISSMSSTEAPQDLGVTVSTTVAFNDGTLDEMKAVMKEVDGVWKMSL